MTQLLFRAGLALVLASPAVVRASDGCTLHLQNHATHAWDAWQQAKLLQSRGYEIAGNIDGARLGEIPVGQSVALQKIWAMTDDRSGRVLCTAQLEILRRTAGSPLPVRVAHRLAVDPAFSRDASAPDCAGAFAALIRQLPVCPKEAP